MTSDRVLVDLIGLALIAFIVWFFWLVKARGVRAAMTGGGYQEQMVLVKGGYTPDVIVVEAGKPVRLNFVRQESVSCSEMVLLPTFNIGHATRGPNRAGRVPPQGAWRVRVRVSDGDVPREDHRRIGGIS